MSTSHLFFDSLILTLARAIEWRRGVLAKHPDDRRNKRAIKSLSELAKGRYGDVLPGTWELIAPYFGHNFLRDAINQANRAVGFSARPRGFDDHLKAIAELAKGYAAPDTIGGAK